MTRQRLFGEFFGTFALIFAGTGAVVVNQTQNGVIGHAGVAIVWGLVVLAMIYAFGDVSGAHFNPAVTLGFCAAGRFTLREAVPYIAVQCLAATTASSLLRVLFPENVMLGATLPVGPVWQSWILELVLTWMLMLVVLNVSTGPKEKGITAGIAVGAVIGLEAMFAGPICGASMNPARSLGPALVSGHLGSLWIYLTAPVLGALLAVPSRRLLESPA
jgi:aquaporin NIP